MGHLNQKYDADYFLGGVDAETGARYGVLGHEEFRAGETHGRHLSEFAFSRELAGSLEGKDVLEIGFGRGDLIPLFLEAGISSYTGIDFSQSAVEIAETRFTDPRVHLSRMDATRLGTDQAFDLVAMYDLIEHVPVFEMEVIWEKVRHVLRPGGYVVVSTPVFDNPNAADHTETIPSVAGIHCHKQTWGTLLRTCAKHGYTIALTADRMLGLVRTCDLPLFDLEDRNRYLEAQSGLMARNGVAGFDGELTRVIERTLVPGAGRVAMGCVADNNPVFLSQAHRLLQSVRWFGGSMAGVNFFVCFVDDSDAEYAREFEWLGAFVRTVPRFSTRHPHSNKLRFLELPELKAYDTVVLLDCDTVVVQDPWDFLDGDVLQAKMADITSVPDEALNRVFQHFGVELPAQDYLCNPGGARTVWHCNAGVLVFPQPFIGELGSAWTDFDTELLDRLDLLPHAFHCDQVSLSLAFASCLVPFRELPLEMNFPLHLTSPELLQKLARVDPVILHYHDRVDDCGYLQPSPYRGAQRRIGLFNERVRESRRRSFNNRLFWDFRYAHSPELGSGFGSRGAVLSYKRGFLRALVNRFEPKSILDVGCGDCEVTAELPHEGYTGTDVSPVAIEKNRTRMPDREFACGDFLELDLEPADLVLCLDVLIHLSDPDKYHAFVEKLVTKTGKRGLVSGYEESPDDGEGMVFFHEPLSTTLHRSGARSVRKVGKYNKVAVWYYEQASVNAEPRSSETKLSSPVFVVGCMRSATTLLAKLLGQFPGIVNCPFELKHVWSSVGEVPMASAKTRDKVCPELGARDVKPGQAERLAQAFSEEMSRESDGKWPDALCLNKNPHLCNKLPFVNALFPDARFIWIHRPLPAVVASIKRLFDDVCERQETWHYWPEPNQEVQARCWQAVHQKEFPSGLDARRVFPGGDVRFIAEYWLESNRAVAGFLATLPDHRWVEVDEDVLIRDPRTHVARCLAMLEQPLEVPFDVAKGIEPPRNDEWKSLLSDEEQTSLTGFMEEHQAKIEETMVVRNPAFSRPHDLIWQSQTSGGSPWHPSTTLRESFFAGIKQRKEGFSMPLCIAGMHRSGTSMVARLLNQCGLYLGHESDLLDPAPDNPQGYSENTHFKELNERILARFGGGWDLPPEVEDGWEQRPELAEIRSEAVKFVESFRDAEPWGWKDPRNSLTISFWRPFFPGLKVIICLRNPLEVAYSLQKRGYSSHAFGFNLWLTYNQRLLAATLPEQRIVTHYETYCADARGELQRVLDWLDWDIPDEIVDRATATLYNSLRSNQVTSLELLEAEVPEEVLELYFAMCTDAGPVYEQLLSAEFAAPQRGGSRAAEAYLRHVLPNHPEPTLARRQYALLLRSAGRIQEAIQQYESILAVDADYSQVYNDLGVLYYEEKQYDKAIAHLEKGVDLNGEDVAALRNLGITYLTVGRTQDAMKVYQEILSRNPRDIDALLLLGDLCRKAGRSEKAAFFYTKVLEVDADNEAAKGNLQALGFMGIS